ncbi:MAG: MerR family DNA-binding transcriptional regulator, partial [Acidobacteriota bacterium]
MPIEGAQESRLVVGYRVYSYSRGGALPEENSFLIGDLAKRAGVHRETLRYYERLGLLRPARRTQSGYRVYDRAA